MHAEIIAIGTELTTGAKLDTNSQWLSIELAAIGIPVHFHSTVADNLQEMVDVLRTSVNRSDIVLMTGGIGPTLDDLTRQALTELVQKKLVLHEPSLEFIRKLFAGRNQPMPERNVIQAMFPEGSEPLFNPRGSAPGIWLEVTRAGFEHRCRVAAMPGVPSEMKRMFQYEVLPRLPKGNQVIQQARVNMFGIGESQAEEMLGELTARGRDPEVGITVHEATITLRVTAHGQTTEECRKKFADTRTLIDQKMGNYVFGIEDEELQDVLIQQLQCVNKTVATAESGTGGLLAHLFSEVSGFDSCFLGGVIVPTDKSKIELLDIPEAKLLQDGPISAEIAIAMATSCRVRFETDFGLAVTECPDFDPDESHTDRPSAFIALVGNGIEECQELKLVGDPAITKSRAAKMAMSLLRLTLLEK